MDVRRTAASLVFLGSWLAGLTIQSGCASSSRSTASLAGFELASLPARVDASTYDAAKRAYLRAADGTAAQARWRALLLEHLAARTSIVGQSNDYDSIVTHFAAMTSLYTPQDYATGQLSPALREAATLLHQRSVVRGDEARLLAALSVLALVDPAARARHQAAYQDIAKWGREARQHLETSMETWSRLIEVWHEHAALTPIPAVLDQLAALHVHRRDAAIVWLKEMKAGTALPEMMWPGEAAALAPLIIRAPLDVAAVYLRHGDLLAAVRHVRAMGERGSTESRVASIIEIAAQRDEVGASALHDLAEVYRSARPSVASGLCQHGLQTFPRDAHFTLCMARLAAQDERHVDMAAWYAQAIEQAPKQLEMYDEALTRLVAVVELSLFQPNMQPVRQLAIAAEKTLEARQARWPAKKAPVAGAQLDLLRGALEMNAGDAAASRFYLQRSLRNRRTQAVLVQLGVLAERTAAWRQATTWYHQALAIATVPTKRAEILEHLGDVWRKSEDISRSRHSYRQALQLWEQALPSLQGQSLAMVHVRRGIMLDRLHDHGRAVEAFRSALRSAPGWRETYATILAHLVVATPDIQLAHEVFRQAQKQLTLEPEWKVYFALWITSIAGRAGSPVDDEVGEMLRELSGTPSWWSQLAKFASGKLAYGQLVSVASSPGQKTEAYFYEGARLLNRGDASGAKQLFQRVLDSRMVSFYEVAMAQELLSTVRR